MLFLSHTRPVVNHPRTVQWELFHAGRVDTIIKRRANQKAVSWLLWGVHSPACFEVRRHHCRFYACRVGKVATKMATPGQKEREAELHSVLRIANLLDYYPSFLEQGGDDVQQFCDASEEEFKEIVGLVGMSTKPLHTRRLQKALVEWKSKRGHSPQRISPGSWMDKWTSSPQVNRTPPASTSSPAASSGRKRRSSSGGGKGVEKRVVELKLPPMEVIIDWEKLDPERQQLIRDHSRIYGRDAKKRKTNTLNSHEQMINEAAAQLCLRDPTLLVRRDELFTMARRVVRDSGFTFVHGHSRSKFVSESDEELDGKGIFWSMVLQFIVYIL